MVWDMLMKNANSKEEHLIDLLFRGLNNNCFLNLDKWLTSLL